MYPLNTAQKMVAAWLGLDLDWFSAKTVRIATAQTEAMALSYKAPHAPRGTPPRPSGGKVKGLRKRLFKGHRV